MSTGFRGDLDIDLDSLEETFHTGHPTDIVVAPGFSRLEIADELDDLLLEGDGRSVPDSVALATIFGRAFRTMAPIVIGDMLALLIAGMVAQLVFGRIYPDAASHIGWIAALLPLVLAYWLSDLYSQIWVHPVVELRQITHVNLVALVSACTAAFLARPMPLWFAVAFPVVVLLVPMFRTIARRAGANFESWGYPTLVIASGANVSSVTELLLSVPHSSLRPVLLTDTRKQCRTSALPVVNDTATLESMVRTNLIRH